MISVILYILGGAIMLCGILSAIIIYSSRQDFLNSLSEAYLKNYSDTDIIPDGLTVKIIGLLIRRVMLTVFMILLVEMSGCALLIVAATI
jgi:hypothetical protein